MRTVVFDIDTQRDFMEPGGGLYVPGAERIVPVVRRVLEAALAAGIPIVATADAHAVDDPEFSAFPPHCIQGTRGQEKVPETIVGPFRLVPDRPIETAVRPDESVLVEKHSVSFLGHPNVGAVLSALRPERCILVGVTTEYCVRSAALGLRAGGCEVVVVTDAVRAVDPAAGAKAIGEMERAGIRMVASGAATAMLAESAAAPAAPESAPPRGPTDR